MSGVGNFSFTLLDSVLRDLRFNDKYRSTGEKAYKLINILHAQNSQKDMPLAKERGFWLQGAINYGQVTMKYMWKTSGR